ncbi:MAG TPA: glycosyltransferase family 4 protein [Solirubrobacteraceae bacterium]|nr:glycosyltransferase family 4 protein [Solirubrobacteraceae bacterium]
MNHTEVISGAERSLLSLLGGLPADLAPLVASPPGRLQQAVAELGVPTAAVAGTAGSLRLHPLHTPRALAELSVAALQVRRLARRHRAEVVHANSIRAGIVLALARLEQATVVHVRDCLPPGALSVATLRLIGASATSVIANSRYTAESVRAMAPGARLEVLYNPVDLARFDPQRLDRRAARAALGPAGASGLLLGVVGQLSPWKGQDTAIEALALVRAQGLDAHLLVIGSAKFTARATRFDNRAYLEGLHRRAAAAGVAEHISWLGEREDVPELVRALDALLLPSWEEPFGRALIEAMALEVPVIATNVGGPAEIVRDGREGRLAPPREPGAWARAIVELAAREDGGAALGRAGRARVEREFTVQRHVADTLAVYERALARGPGARARS